MKKISKKTGYTLALSAVLCGAAIGAVFTGLQNGNGENSVKTYTASAVVDEDAPEVLVSSPAEAEALGNVKYKTSVDGKYLLLATGFSSSILSDVSLAYIGYSYRMSGGENVDTTQVGGTVSTCYGSIQAKTATGTVTWTAEDLFGESADSLIVYEIALGEEESASTLEQCYAFIREMTGETPETLTSVKEFTSVAKKQDELKGYGTQAFPYLIENDTDWATFAKPENLETYRSAYVKLKNDVNATAGFGATDSFTASGFTGYFSGHFLGEGHTVNVTLSTSTSALGMICYAGGNAVVENVTVKGSVSSSFSGQDYNGVGGVVGNVHSGGATVENCVNHATVTSTNVNAKAGGVIGKADAQTTVKNCKNYGEVTASATSATYTGGIVAYIQVAGTVVESCENYGEVSGAKGVGGIVGLINNGTEASLTQIKDCLNEGAVSGTTQVGGVVGRVAAGKYAAVENCSNTGDISGTNGKAANLTGNVEGDEVGSVIGSIGTVANVTFTHEHALDSSTEILASYATAGSKTGTCTLCERTVEIQELPAQKDVTDGTYGTESNPYTIANSTDYEAFAAAVNDGNSFSGKYIKLTENIGSAESPITTVIGTSTNPFKGTFDGNDKTVTLSISASELYAGMFGYISGATVKNVVTEGSVESTVGYLGGVIGYSATGSTISGCINRATVTGGSTYVGGIVGTAGNNSANNTTVISTCKNYGAVTATGYVGGIAGSSGKTSQIGNCENYASVTGNSSDSSRTGGIAGEANGNVTGCINGTAGTEETVSGSGNYVGGIVGCTQTAGIMVSDCTNYMNVKSTGATGGTGGIVGLVNADTTISVCNNYGTLSQTNTNGYVGGIIGRVAKDRTATVTGCGTIAGTADKDLIGSIGGTANISGTVDLQNPQ